MPSQDNPFGYTKYVALNLLERQESIMDYITAQHIVSNEKQM